MEGEQSSRTGRLRSAMTNLPTFGSAKHYYSAPAETIEPSLNASESDLHPDANKSHATTSEKSTAPSSIQGLPFRGNANLIFHWWLEVAACLLAVAALLATFATLYAYGNKPLPDWGRLSINTVIAIYVVLLKSGILLVTAEGIGQLKWRWFSKSERPLADLVKYDDATRGPVGAGKLLFGLYGRDLVASLGAIIIVLSLAVDPFMQQIIQYYNCALPVPGSIPSIPRSNYFVQQGGLHTGALEQSITPGVQSAINSGVFNPARYPSIECSSGNCTWPAEYSTVGWCSKCEDITDQLQITNKTFLYRNTTTASNLTTAIPQGISANMTTPPLNFATWEYAAMGPSPNRTGGMDFLLAKDPEGVLDPSTGMHRSGCNGSALNSTWTCRGYGASRCIFSPCVKSYTSSVSAGQLTETLKDTAEDWGFGTKYSPVLTMLDLDCVNAGEKQSLHDLGYRMNDTQRWLAYNATFNLNTYQANNTFPESMMLRGCVYAVDMTFESSIGLYFASQFNGIITGPIIAGEMPLGSFSGPQLIQTMFNFGNVTFDRINESFENISTAMTNYMRQNGMANFSSPALGIASQTKTCIAVRWPWMVFPSALVVMTLVFFALLLIETRHPGRRPQIWKSSPLALLYHGLAGHEDRTLAFGDLDHANDMSQRARATGVRLAHFEDNSTHLVVQRSIHT